jgi:hypothetical protein
MSELVPDQMSGLALELPSDQMSDLMSGLA